MMNTNKKQRDIKNLMIGLDLSEIDEVVISYAKFLVDYWNLEKITFIHNIKKSDLYDLWEGFLKEKEIPLENLIKKEISEKVAKVFDDSAQIKIEVTAEDYTENVFKEKSKEYNIDLLLLGKKQDLRGTGSLAHKLMHIISCDVLFVPEEVQFSLNRILLPTDFTSNSAKAFKKASLLDHKKSWQMIALHVYNIPSVYFPYINREKAMDKAQQQLTAKFKNFRKRFKLEEIPFIQSYREDFSVVETIIEKSYKENIDLIMLSAKGDNKLTSIFVGSTTSDLLLNNSPVPIYVVK